MPLVTEHVRRHTEKDTDEEVDVQDLPDQQSWMREQPEDEREQSPEPEVECSRCEAISAVRPSLAERSRLRDDSFYENPASACYVPFKIQMGLMKTALRLAQETLWCELRVHWPEKQRERFLEGPETIKFGRDELFDSFGGSPDYCYSPKGVSSKVLQVVYLGNAVCHPNNYHSTKAVDDLIEHAQALAVDIGDEVRAMKIRKLRDTLQAEAKKAYAEIETYETLATLPFAKPWALHHQRLFKDVAFERYRMYQPNKVWDVIVRAAKAWRMKYRSPGEFDPIYLANTERARSFIRESKHGRRASVSAVISRAVPVVKKEVLDVTPPTEQPAENDAIAWSVSNANGVWVVQAAQTVVEDGKW